MGEHCELMVKEWNISRQEQDELALASHRNAAQAYKEGFMMISSFHSKEIRPMEFCVLIQPWKNCQN